MGIEQLIAATGIVSFVLFLLSAVNGIPKLRLLRYHAVTSYSCLVILILHVAAIKCDIYEPLGMIAALAMLLTIISGRFRWKLRRYWPCSVHPGAYGCACGFGHVYEIKARWPCQKHKRIIILLHT